MWTNWRCLCGSGKIFMGAFSHELKTPMTAIIGYADTLRSMQVSRSSSAWPRVTFSRSQAGGVPEPEIADADGALRAES